MQPAAPTRLAVVPGVEVFASGTYDQGTYTLADLCEIARNTNRLGPDGEDWHTVPLGALNRVGVGHEDDQAVARLFALDRSDAPAVGAVRNARVVPYYAARTGRWEGSLFADLYDVTPDMAESIRRKRYRKVSAEVYDDFADRYGGRHGKALKRVSLIGYAPPVVKGMADLPMPHYFAERLQPARRVTTGPGTHACFAEYTPMVTKEALVLAAKGASPETDDSVIGTIIDAVLTVVPEAAAADAPAEMAEGEGGGMDRAGMIEWLAGQGQDAAALEALSDADLKALYDQMKSGGPAAAGGAAMMSEVKKYAEQAIATAIAPLVKQVSQLVGKAKADADKVQKFSEAADLRDRQSAVAKVLDEVTGQGRMLPAERDLFHGLLMKADRNKVEKFSEGGKEYAETEFDRIARQLRGRPALVKFAERATQAFTPDPADPELNKVRAFAESNADTLRKAGSTADRYVAAFAEHRKKKPGLTAREYGVPAD
jgi:hypothetical protein